MPDKMTKESLKKWTENLKDPAKDQIIELDKKDKKDPLQNEKNIKRNGRHLEAPAATQ